MLACAKSSHCIAIQRELPSLKKTDVGIQSPPSSIVAPEIVTVSASIVQLAPLWRPHVVYVRRPIVNVELWARLLSPGYSLNPQYSYKDSSKEQRNLGEGPHREAHSSTNEQRLVGQKHNIISGRRAVIQAPNKRGKK